MSSTTSVGYGRLGGGEQLDAAVRRLLAEHGDGWRALPSQALKSKIHRLRFRRGDAELSLVAKWMKPDVALRNERVLRRWLPAVDLASLAPRLLAVAAAPDGSCVWHVYEDLGNSRLDAASLTPERADAVAATLARLHATFRAHPLLGECWHWGGDLGAAFLRGNVLHALHALRGISNSAPRAGIRDRLEDRLQRLEAELPRLEAALSPPREQLTMLHGDLWLENFVVDEHSHRPIARLIDWDHAGVGPVSYDLSTLLSRFAPRERRPLLERYRVYASRQGVSLPDQTALNEQFEACELSRISNRVIWPAIHAGETGAESSFEELEEVDRWFEALAPLLPENAA